MWHNYEIPWVIRLMIWRAILYYHSGKMSMTHPKALRCELIFLLWVIIEKIYVESMTSSIIFAFILQLSIVARYVWEAKKFHFYGLESEKKEKQRAIFRDGIRYVINTLSHMLYVPWAEKNHYTSRANDVTFSFFSSHVHTAEIVCIFSLCFVC